MTRFRVLLIAVLLGGIAAEAPAQPLWGGGAIPFAADAASFPDSAGGARTEFYVSIPLTSLNFENTGSGRPLTRVSVVAIFYDEKDRQITGDDWIYRDIPGSLQREENEGRSLTRRYRFKLPEGKIRAKVRIEEPRTGLFGELEFEFEVPEFDRESLIVSDLVFGLCREMVVSAPAGDFVGPVFPHPSHRYGDDAPSICVYAMLQDRLDAPGDYRIRYRVKKAGGRTVEDSTFVAPRTGGAGEVLLRPRFTGLSLGRYELELEVDLGEERVRRGGTFDVDETRISFIRDSEKLRSVLAYVATNDELHTLDFVPDDSLGSFWRSFWVRRDPTPDTRHNEALIEFLRRVDYATRNFGVLEPGWRSDRGRIYIKYGAPDQVERILNDAYRPPTEIWYYYGRNATYVFQDTDGFGRYRLVGARRD